MRKCIFITHDNNRLTIGYYSTKEEAVEARKQAEIELFGEYRRDED